MSAQQRKPTGHKQNTPDSAASQVTIIVPSYNPGAQKLKKLAQLKSQLPAELHWVVVDDGSSQEAQAAIAALSNQGFEVARHEQNRGLPAARNTGIAATDRPYVFPLDDDDSVAREFFELAVPLASSKPEIGFIYCWAKVIGKHSHTFECEPWSEIALLKRNLCCASALIRRSAWAQVDGYDENLTKGLEDWDLWLKFAAAGISGHLIPRPLFTYNQSPDSMLNGLTLSGERWEEHKRLVARHQQLYERHLPELITTMAQELANARTGFIERNLRRLLSRVRS